jgi:hypothetical protein
MAGPQAGVSSPKGGSATARWWAMQRVWAAREFYVGKPFEGDVEETRR